jgi:cytidylate kinase
MTIIAMTREMGTLGKDVAKHLVDRLDVRLVHHELVEAPLDRRETRTASEVHRYLEEDGDNADQRDSTLAGDGYLTPEDILSLASRGDVIFRGWGAARLLHSFPHILCVRICAPMEDRIREMMQRLGVEEASARDKIKRNDNSHASVFTRFFGADWRDPLNYDLVLNTGQINPEGCADIIIDAIKSPAFSESDVSRKELADQLTKARITSLFKATEQMNNRTKNVYVSVAEGNVTLYGAVCDVGAAGDIEKAIQAHIGSNAVQNDIQTIGPYTN